MHKLHLSGSLTLAVALAAGLISPAAHAQCTWFMPDVPDIDQKRLSDLPNDGRMYCAPTSMTNWFAYVANRGVPQPLTLAGPRDWESSANYDRVTDVLTFMGTLMETHPTEGTRGGTVSGAKAYASFACPGDFIISGSWTWGSGGTPPTPEAFTDLHNLGAYLCASYGFYSSSTGGTRGGGHVITITGVWDLTCGQAPILQFNDPNDDPTNSTQSEFHTSIAALNAVTGQFRSSTSDSFSTKTLYRLDTDVPSTNFLDAVYAILPLSAIFSGPSSFVGQLELVTPFRPAGNPAPASRMFNTPSGTGNVLDVAAGPTPLIHYYITSRTGQQNAGAWKLDLTTGISTRLTTNLNPSRIAIGRLGDLYVLDNDGVNRYDLSTTPATYISTFTPSTEIEALAYDDKNDTVLMLSKLPGIGSRRVLSFPRTLTGFGSDRALPVSLNGAPYIAPDAETAGAFFVCASDSPTLSRIDYSSAAGALVTTDSITHINGGLTALNVTDANHLVYAVNGSLVEREQNSQGNWVSVTNSRWAGRSANGQVSMTRSRHPFVASIYDNPSFNNLTSTIVYPGLPSCYANCDNSTVAPVLNANDFQCFLNKFAAKHPYANCDNSTVNPVLTANDFQCFLNKFAAGCT